MGERIKMGLKHGRKPETFLVGFLPLLLWSVARIIVVAEAAASAGLELVSSAPCSFRDPLSDPIHEMHHGHDVVWQIPSDRKAVLLFAHGYGTDSFVYFDPGPNCEQCYGLPEHRTVVLEALRRRYAVIVVSVDAADMEGADAPIVYTVVKEWMAEHMLDSLPLAVWGHASGTYLATALTLSIQIQAMVLMCGEGIFEVEEVATPLKFPPTIFAYMPVDESDRFLNHTGKAKTAMAVLSLLGVKVAYTELWPKPLSPLFFTERILCMSEEVSRAIYAAYETAGWIDANGYLTRDPSQEDWQSVLLNAKALPLCPFGNLCLGAQVEQELKMAFAMHSFTSDGNGVIFPWLDSTISSSSGFESSILESPALSATI